LTDAREHDALDAALDRLIQGVPAHAPEGLDPLVRTARAAREAFSLQVPEAVARAHVAALTGVATLERRRPRHRIALVLIAAAITAILLGGAAVSASASALPGELLYPVKRAVERVELMIHRDPASQAKLHLEYAQRRLAELSALQALRRAGQSVDVGAAMRAYQGEVNAAEHALAEDRANPGYAALAAALDAQLERHLAVLSSLKDNALPGPAQVAISKAIQHVDQAHSAIANTTSGKKQKPFPTERPATPATSPSRSRSR
jgi:hypothetical protein